MEYLDVAVTVLTIMSPVLGGAAAIFAKKALFFLHATQQAMQVMEKIKISNLKIYEEVRKNPANRELVQVVEGAVKQVKGLSGIREEK